MNLPSFLVAIELKTKKNTNAMQINKPQKKPLRGYTAINS